MISVRMLKLVDRMRLENGFDTYSQLHKANTNIPNYIRSEIKFFSKEICQTCKDKLNLNKDKFIKEK